MKLLKVFAFILIGSLFIRCGKSGASDCDHRLIISLPDNYYWSSIVDNMTPTVFVTSDHGELIDDFELQNDSDNEICLSPLDRKMDITIVTKHKLPNYYRYKLRTFLDVDPQYISVVKEPKDTCEGKIILTERTNIHSFDPTYKGSSTKYGTTTEITIRTTSEQDQYYASYRDGSETHKRYLWVENLTCGSRDTFHVPSAKTIDKPYPIHYPENNRVREQIHGRSTTKDWDFTRIKYTDYTFPQTSIQTYIPFELFDEFKIATNLRRDSMWFSKTIITKTIDTVYTLPEIEILNADGNTQDLSIETSGDIEYFSVSLKNTDTPTNVEIDWNIHGKIDGDLSYKLPQVLTLLDENLIGVEPEFLEIKTIKLENFFGSLEYKNFMEHKLDTYVPYDSDKIQYYESIFKYEN